MPLLPLLLTSAAWMPPLAAHVAGRARAFGYEFTPGPHAFLALIAGVLILIRPKFLNFIVAVYLIIIGLTGLVHLSF